VRLDRKLLLIAPTIVLLCVIAGIIYASAQLHVLSSISDSLKDRSDFIASVERGEKTLSARQAVGIIRFSFDVETKRTAAIVATRDLLLVLSAIGLAALVTLAIGIRSVPREHWPRFTTGRGSDA
jgi:hypothetical protein